MSISHDVLIVMASLAIYKKQGVINAIKYLEDDGYEHDEAIDLIASYDKMEEAADSGLLNDRRLQ